MKASRSHLRKAGNARAVKAKDGWPVDTYRVSKKCSFVNIKSWVLSHIKGNIYMFHLPFSGTRQDLTFLWDKDTFLRHPLQNRPKKEEASTPHLDFSADIT